jgi:predicted N-acyltransferase
MWPTLVGPLPLKPAHAEAKRVERLFGIEYADETSWRALEPPDFPFFDFEFLRALERSGSIGGSSGWSPVYIVCKEARGRLLGALCL